MQANLFFSPPKWLVKPGFFLLLAVFAIAGSAWDEMAVFNQPPRQVQPESSSISGITKLCNQALASAPQLTVSRAEFTHAQLQAAATGLLPNPSIGGSWKHVGNIGNGGSIGISQELPINGVRQLERQQAYQQASAEFYRLQRLLQMTYGAVAEAYVGVLAASRELAIQREAVKLSEESLRIIAQKHQAGLTTDLPLYLAKVDLANHQTDCLLAENHLDEAYQRLAYEVCGDAERMLPVVGNLEQPLVVGNPGERPAQRPDLIAARLDAVAAGLSVQVARRERIPNPVVGYEHEQVHNDREDSFKLEIELPIFNNGRQQVKAASAHQLALQTRLAAVQKQIDREMVKAQSSYRVGFAEVQLYENQIQPSLKQAAQAAQQAFQSGTSDLSLLLETQNNLIQRKLAYLEALKYLRLAEIEMCLAYGAMDFLAQ